MKIAGNKYFKFTCETWNPGERPSRNETKNISMVTDESFPFLELDLFWDNSGKLEFQVH